MREILFRGKAFDIGWVEGLLVWVDHSDETALIRTIDKDGVGYFDFLVDFETVGQYTGLTDKNGKKIFEGDIISSGNFCCFFVEYSEEDSEYWANFGDSIGSLHTYFSPKSATVIGNIHDNPELLEVAK